MGDHFGIENRMAIEDDYKPRAPKLSFDISRGYGVPVIADVSAEEIESMQVMQLRREAKEVTQNQARSMLNAEQARNERLTEFKLRRWIK